jgi:hypothetical protein
VKIGREKDTLGALLLPRIPHRRGAIWLRVRRADTCLGPTHLVQVRRVTNLIFDAPRLHRVAQWERQQLRLEWRADANSSLGEALLWLLQFMGIWTPLAE